MEKYLLYLGTDESEEDRKKIIKENTLEEAIELIDLKEYEKALEILSEVIRNDSREIRAYICRVECLENMGKYENAIKDCATILSINNESVEYKNKRNDFIEKLCGEEEADEFRYITGDKKNRIKKCNSCMSSSVCSQLDDKECKEYRARPVTKPEYWPNRMIGAYVLEKYEV